MVYASLSIKSEAGKVLDHDTSASMPFVRQFKTRNSPSRQRRRARRVAERLSEEEGSKKVPEEEGSKKVYESQIVDNEVVPDAAEKVVSSENKDIVEVTTVTVDEVCNDQEYGIETTVCSIELFPKSYADLDSLANFRNKMQDYFENRKDVVKRIIKCEVKNYGSHVLLIAEVNVKRGWIFFFCDPDGNYGDLEGLRTVRHACVDLSKCGG